MYDPCLPECGAILLPALSLLKGGARLVAAHSDGRRYTKFTLLLLDGASHRYCCVVQRLLICGMPASAEHLGAGQTLPSCSASTAPKSMCTNFDYCSRHSSRSGPASSFRSECWRCTRRKCCAWPSRGAPWIRHRPAGSRRQEPMRAAWCLTLSDSAPTFVRAAVVDPTRPGAPGTGIRLWLTPFLSAAPSLRAHRRASAQ